MPELGERRLQLQYVAHPVLPPPCFDHNFLPSDAGNDVRASHEVPDGDRDFGLAGEFELIRQFLPLDSTTNPSLVLKAVKDPKYAHFLRAALAEDKGSSDPLRYSLSHAAFLTLTSLDPVVCNCWALPGRRIGEARIHSLKP